MDKPIIDTQKGDEFAEIATAFCQAGGSSVHDTWTRLAQYWRERNWSEEARWCQLRAEGKSWKEAYELAYGKLLPWAKSSESVREQQSTKGMER